MYQADELEVWNLTPDVPVLTGAQKIFNVVGRLKSPEKTSNLYYSLNNAPEKMVFFNPGPGRSGRLENPGDFNVDTIATADLRAQNQITFRIVSHVQSEKIYRIVFPNHSYEEREPKFQLNLNGIEQPHQIGQVLEGKWQVELDELGEPFMEIKREDAGLDRIILFGRQDWTTSYEITARLCVTAWISRPFNVGLLFKWNPHLQGDGTFLPTQWSTGLGYYSSYNPGLRIRFGVNVRYDSQGNKVGDYVLRDGRLSLWRWWIGRVIESPFGSRVARKILHMSLPFTEIVPGKLYCFKMLVDPEKYTLSVWKHGRREPSSQLVVPKPVERLANGSVGIIAYNCAVRVYDFNVSPV